MGISAELKAAVEEVQRRLTEEKVEWVMAYDDGTNANLAAGASPSSIAVWGAQYTARAVTIVERNLITK